MLNYDKDRAKYPVVYDNKYGITKLDELLRVESFESSVILQRTQTERPQLKSVQQFESSVILQRTQTAATIQKLPNMFESSVILQRTQTTIGITT